MLSKCKHVLFLTFLLFSIAAATAAEISKSHDSGGTEASLQTDLSGLISEFATGNISKLEILYLPAETPTATTPDALERNYLYKLIVGDPLLVYRKSLLTELQSIRIRISGSAVGTDFL